MKIISKLAGCGSYLPQNTVTNDELAKKVDTTDEWIVARTGISQRHFAADDEYTSDLALKAAERALEHAGIDGADIDLIVVGTTTPDRTFPAVAVRIQKEIGCRTGAAFDVQAVCSGFIFAMSVVDSMIKTGQAKNALVIGAETISRIIDWEDRTTCVLFGDGAGAIVIQAEEVDDQMEGEGVLSTHIHSDGKLEELLYCSGGVSTTQTSGYLTMAGKEVFKHAVTNLAAVVGEALEANNLQDSDLDWLVPHQANMRIITSTAKKLKMPMDKVILTVQQHANTSAASIPLALDHGVKTGLIKRGDLILMEAMGGGLTWGAALARW
ncbi:MAG: ketoacyl-ACP synthase III [Rhodospirillaceae bacterium]|jgi:3-oxoacyl-[acyl-carrier-protein] synthase III|nr:ketoacyl-ACP synthase III [Rhodospirillaceae bacterium]MBT4588174.1 ketoacyl-ACP synthase III [Rhodospirillaceae bacterium]MBT5940490.1 ketoacyl-ACP synthase III [Rhodospirillaceae bacterium]MBT7266997.1 ketoacyl-ACP synthase III [Rhodospirillaceae bacterium]